MASVRDTVYDMLTEYPILFRNKSSCFNHLFLTIGNGFEWEDGELVERFKSKSVPDFRDENEEVEKLKKRYNLTPELIGILGGLDHIRLQTRRDNAAIQFAIDNIDLMIKEDVSFTNDIHYSGREFCPVMKTPDDIKPDWEEAVKEVICALHMYVNSNPHHVTNEEAETIEQLAKDLEWLKKKNGVKE